MVAGMDSESAEQTAQGLAEVRVQRDLAPTVGATIVLVFEWAIVRIPHSAPPGLLSAVLRSIKPCPPVRSGVRVWVAMGHIDRRELSGRHRCSASANAAHS